jgi:hypothetical protein
MSINADDCVVRSVVTSLGRHTVAESVSACGTDEVGVPLNNTNRDVSH